MIQHLQWWAQGEFGNSPLPWSQGDLTQGLQFYLHPNWGGWGRKSPSFYPSKSPEAPPKTRTITPQVGASLQNHRAGDGSRLGPPAPQALLQNRCLPVSLRASVSPGRRSDALGFISLQHPSLVPVKPSMALFLLFKAFWFCWGGSQQDHVFLWDAPVESQPLPHPGYHRPPCSDRC